MEKYLEIYFIKPGNIMEFCQSEKVGTLVPRPTYRIFAFTQNANEPNKTVISMINVFIRTRPSDPVNFQNEAEHTSTVEVPGSCRSIRRLRTYDPQVSVRQPTGGRGFTGGSVTPCSAGNARISGCCEKNQRYPYSKYNNLVLFGKK